MTCRSYNIRYLQRADNLLDNVQAYLRGVGSQYIGHHDDIANQIALIDSAIGEIRGALKTLIEEL